MTRSGTTASFTLPLAAAALAACGAATATPAVSGPPPGAGGADAPFERVVAPFTVLDENGRAYAHPFIGGFDVPRPQFVDIDGDGDLDLFVQERSNDLMFFENTGTPAEPRYVWRTDRYADLDIGEWFRFVDMDGDGIHDLISESPYSHVRLYANVGTRSAPEFRMLADTLRDADGAPIFADRQNIANAADIDCDGLMDLFLGRVDGSITRYEETPASSGNAAPRFRFVTDRFENISIVAAFGSMHGANSMYFADYDGDGDLDLFWGDFFEPGVLLIREPGHLPGAQPARRPGTAPHRRRRDHPLQRLQRACPRRHRCRWRPRPLHRHHRRRVQPEPHVIRQLPLL
jgi:hypothetical protein